MELKARIVDPGIDPQVECPVWGWTMGEHTQLEGLRIER